MGTKATGAEIKAYWDEWPEGNDWYIDDFTIDTHNEVGEFLLELDKKYDIADLGTLCYNGDWSEIEEPHKDLSASFRKWKRKRDQSEVLVTVPKKDIDGVLQQLEQMGLKYKVL